MADNKAKCNGVEDTEGDGKGCEAGAGVIVAGHGGGEKCGKSAVEEGLDESCGGEGGGVVRVGGGGVEGVVLGLRGEGHVVVVVVVVWRRLMLWGGGG